MTKYLNRAYCLLITVNRNLPEIMTCGSRIVPNGPQNIIAHTMGVSSLKGPQAVEELL